MPERISEVENKDVTKQKEFMETVRGIVNYEEMVVHGKKRGIRL